MSADLTAGAGLRFARAIVLSCAVLTFASVAHVGVGGSLPGRSGMTVLTVLTTAFLASQLGRPASTARVVVLLAGGQAALHGVFTAAGGHPGAAGAMADRDMSPVRAAVPRGGIADVLGADQIAAGLSTRPSPVNAWVHHLVEDLSTPANQRMAVAHLAAAALLGVWLASGERLVWRLVVLLAGPTATALAQVQALLLGGLAATGRRITSWTPASVVPRWDDPPPPATIRLACTVVRRGPPAFSS